MCVENVLVEDEDAFEIRGRFFGGVADWLRPNPNRREPLWLNGGGGNHDVAIHVTC